MRREINDEALFERLLGGDQECLRPLTYNVERREEVDEDGAQVFLILECPCLRSRVT